jgi:exosortase
MAARNAEYANDPIPTAPVLCFVFPGVSVFMSDSRRQLGSLFAVPRLWLSYLNGAVAVFWTAHSLIRADDNRLALQIVSLILLWISGFILFYGVSAARAAAFPLLFLFLMIPLPDFVIDKAIFSLQAGSAIVATWLFRLLKVPAWREGFILHLPTLNLEVAKECSGIRSSVVLLITTLLVGQFVLRSLWAKSLLVLSILPVVILKNGVRIVTIAAHHVC